jgi:tRNA nucleotidyltransferase (CCA-adding enzyme)
VFEPAALFVLVALNRNVQLVARSSSDSLDVGRIAEQFGGGGHERAAAALIRSKSIEDVRQELERLLPKMIKPPTTVGEIMSRDPQVLAPNTTVAEASERMHRFGHEGYPIVDGDRTLGLLTRRAVDKAMSHDMGDRPVASVMNAGEVMVHPSDSVQQLQQVMMEHNWGQVPVADQESGKIIGIVTRTDLLKILAPNRDRGPSSNLAEKLEKVLPSSRLRLLKIVALQAEENKDALYIVGGFVRDLILGAPSVDFDLVVEGDAIALARQLAKRYGGRVSSHRRFGTAKWRLDWQHAELVSALGQSETDALDLPISLDFVTARAEFYAHPTALPSVQTGSIKLDLHRRDFTINTLALRLDGRYFGHLLDHWGGGQDLSDGWIRVLHSISFVDDPTRALRAVRLEQRLGFSIEARTLELLEQALPLLDRVSGDRIRNELAQIFKEEHFPQIMQRLSDLGLLTAIHSALVWDAWVEARFQIARQFKTPEKWRLSIAPSIAFTTYASWLFRLSREEARSVCDRLRFSVSDRAVLLGANRLANALPMVVREGRPSDIVMLLDDVPEQALAAAWVAFSDDHQTQAAIDRYLHEWRFLEPKTDGNDLRDLGLEPGPAYGNILWELRAAWLDGEVRKENQERELLKHLLTAQSNNDPG